VWKPMRGERKEKGRERKGRKKKGHRLYTRSLSITRATLKERHDQDDLNDISENPF